LLVFTSMVNCDKLLDRVTVTRDHTMLGCDCDC
jgi:hypothetical protein